MQIDKYLIINNRGHVELRERQPRLAGNEIALNLMLNVPDELFERPTLVAKMTIPQAAVPKSTITPQITDNIERIVKEATGLNLVVTVVEHPEETEKQ
jgi:hypothetical protein